MRGDGYAYLRLGAGRLCDDADARTGLGLAGWRGASENRRGSEARHGGGWWVVGGGGGGGGGGAVSERWRPDEQNGWI